jgi:hypothetical protein
VLSGEERDRLMALRENYNLTGNVTMCDATPMPKSSLKSINSEIIEQAVREITEKVLSRLNNN